MALLGSLTVGILGDMTGLSKTFRGAQTEVQRFGRQMERIGRDISSIGDTLTRNITTPAVAAAGALTSITLVKGFGRLMGIDTARAKLKALGHDAESIESIMESALEAVRGTAFGFDEAATIAASAVAAGVERGQELTRYLSLTSDAAAVAGASLADMGAVLNKVTTSGRAYNSELQMLSDRGLPVYQWLAEEANTTADAIFDMASKGQVSTEMLLDAIEKNIGGAAKTMGEESFAAAIRNIGADISRIGAAFLDAGGEAGGFFSSVKPLLTEFRAMLATVEEQAAGWGERFGQLFNNIVERIRNLKAWFDDLSPAVQSVILNTLGFGAAFLIGIGPALKIVGNLVSLYGKLAQSIGLLSGPVGIVAASVAGLIALGFLLWQNWDTVKERLRPIFEAFSPMIDTLKESFQSLIASLGPIWESLKQLFESLMPILAALGMAVAGVVVPAIGIFISAFSGLVAAIGPVVNAFINLLDVVVNFFSAMFALITGNFSLSMEFFKKASESSIEFVKNLWEGIKNFFKAFVETVIEFFKGLYEVLVGNSIIPDMVSAILSWITNMGTWVKERVLEMIGAVIGFFVDMKDRAVRRVQDMVNNIRNKFNEMREAVQERMERIRDKIEELWNKAQSFLENIDLFQIGKDIIQGLINGIGSMGTAVWEAAKGIARNVKESIMSFLEISSPSRLAIWIMEMFGRGMVIGADRSLSAISRKASELARAAIPDMRGMQMAYALPDFSDRISRFSSAQPLEGYVGSLLPPIIVNNTIEMDRRAVGRALTEIIIEEQERMRKREARARGD